MTRPLIRLGAVLAAALLVSGLATSPHPAEASSVPSTPPTGPVAKGDTLLVNHGFESGLTGWTLEPGRDGTPLPSGCLGQVTVSTGFVVSGKNSARLQKSPTCRVPAVAATPVAVVPGTAYTAFVGARSDRGGAAVGVRFFDATGTVLTGIWSTRTDLPEHTVTTLRVSATAPPGAARASVVVEANNDTSIDDALFSAEFTDVGGQMNVPSQANGTTYALDEHGRDTSYTVVAGASGASARLIGIDLLSAAVTTDLPIPGATGSWGATTAPDGTVYVGTYSNARLYSYHPGDGQLTDLGQVAPGATYAYGVIAGPDGSVYGGTALNGTLWKYTPGTGYSTIGPRPIAPRAQYIRQVALDTSTGLVFAATGTVGSHVIACAADGTGTCVDVLPKQFQSLPWGYNVTAGGGHVLARITDGGDLGHLVDIAVSRGADGTIRSTFVKEMTGVSYPGASDIVDDSAFYTKTKILYRYDLATDVETNLGVDTGIWARSWQVRHLADQTAYPGNTLVGTNSGGVIARYNLTTATFSTAAVASLPKVSTEIETVIGGPDGRVYTSGGFGGGLGVYSPMRFDQQVQHSGQTGYWQAEGMTVLGDRIYQGIYPGSGIQSFTPQDAAAGTKPTVHCSVDGQDRPFGMLAEGGKIYAGTMAVYGQLAGALTVFDPATGRCTTHPDVVHNQTIVSLAASGGKVFGGSYIWGSAGTTPTETEAKLLVFDPVSETSTTVALPVRGLRAITAMATAPDGTVWMVAERYVLAYDPATSTWTTVENAFPEQAAGGSMYAYDTQMVLAGDDTFYAAGRGYLFRIDPTTGAVTRILRAGVSRIGLDGFGNVYTAYAGSHLLRYVVPSGPTG